MTLDQWHIIGLATFCVIAALLIAGISSPVVDVVASVGFFIILALMGWIAWRE